MILNGAYMKGNEVETLRKSAFNNKNFNTIFEVVQDYESVQDEDLKVHFAYKGDLLTSEEKVVSGRQINLINDKKTVKLTYYELDNFDLPEELVSMAQVLVVNEDGSKYLIAIRTNEKGEARLETIINDYSEAEIPEMKEELPDDPSYIPQEETDNHLIKPLAWWTGDGCLPGGYQHCGANCGYSPRTHGGGSPINATDTCCILHDDCYASSAANCSCDTMLKECTKNHSTWAALGIQVYFRGC